MDSAMTRADFMAFFRNDETLNTLTTDDRIEIFSQILTGSSDISVHLLQEILKDYCVSHLQISDEPM